MWIATIILAAIGLSLLTYVKINDHAEAYGLILPGSVGIACLLVAIGCGIAAACGVGV